MGRLGRVVVSIVVGALVALGVPILAAAPAQAVGFSISGNVSGSEPGNPPLPDIVVTAFDLDDVQAGTTTTDADGRYSLDLPDGEYRLVFTSPTGDRAPGELYAFVFGEDSPFNDVYLDPTGALAGVVKDDAGTPVQAELTLFRDAGGVFGDFDYVAQTTSAPDGSYRFDALASGTNYVLRIDTASECTGACPALAPEYWQNVDPGDDPTLITVTSGSVTTISPSVARQSDIRGTIKRAGVPVADAWVDALLVGDEYASYGAGTAEDGTFSLSLPAGSYKLRVSSPGFADFWYSAAVDRVRATVVTVPAQTTVPVGVISFPFTGAVSGTVRSGGVPVVDGGSVDVYDSRGHYVTSSDINANGTYLVQGLAPGGYELDAGPVGHDGANATVTVGTTTVVKDFSVIATPAAATVQVSAKTAAGAALTGGGWATLYKAGAEGYDIEVCRLASDTGTCTMTVPAGNYQLGVEPDAAGYATSFYGGGDSQRTSQAFTVAAGETSPRAVTVVAAGSIALTVANETSQAADADINVVRAGTGVADDFLYSIPSGGSSSVSIPRLRTGTYTVTARSSRSGEVLSAVVAVAAGAAAPATLTLSAESAAEVEASTPAKGDVTGLVRVPGGAPAVDYRVCAYDQWADQDLCDATDATGRYVIQDVHADPFLYLYVTPKNGEYQSEVVVNHRPAVVTPTQVPDIQLAAPVSLGGRVTFDGTTPASDVWISLQGQNGEYGSAVTGPDGRWTVSRVRPGIYKVLADPSSVAYEKTWRPAALDAATATPYDATTGGSTTTLDVDLRDALVSTTTTLTVTGDAGAVGNDVTLKATVAAFGGGSVSGGSVSFVNDNTGAVLGTATVVGGVASLPWTVPSKYVDIVATYGGSTTYGSSRDFYSGVAVGYATTTSLTAPATAVAGAQVQLTAAVASTNPAIPNLGGTVDFYSGGTYLGGTVVSSGAASITTTRLGAGTHQIQAFFDDYDSFGGCGALAESSGCVIVGTGRGRFESSSSTIKTITVTAAPATTGKVTGTVTRDGGTVALPEVVVTLYKADGTLVRETSSSATGTFAFGAVPAGSYRVRFSGVSVVSEWWKDQTSQASSTAITVTAGASTALAASLAQPPGAVTGTVKDGDGNLVDADVRVCLSGVAPSISTCRTTTTDGNAAYSVLGLSAGSYVVTAQPLQDGLRSAAKAVTVAAVPVVADIVVEGLAGPPPTVTVGGSIGTVDGLPVIYWQNATPLTWTACANGTAATWTAVDDAGKVRTGPLTPAAAGSTTYTGTIPAFFPTHGDVHITFAITCPGTGATTTEFDVYIDPSGVVKDTNGNPIAGATVVLKRFDAGSNSYRAVPDGSSVMSPSNRTNPDTTSADGRFGWDVTAGHYIVTASKTGCFKPGSPGTASVSTSDLEIPPPVTDLQLVLQCPSLPGAPTITSAVPGNGSATVTWTAPASNGGAPILDYTVVASPGGASVVTSGLSATVPGLVNGQTYTFTVTARTVAGSGPASAASAPITLPIQGDGGGGGTLPPTLALTGSASAVTVGKPGLTWRTTARSYPVARVEVQSRVALVAGGFGAWAPAATLAAGATSWTLASPKPAASYCLQVRAVDTQGNSSAWAQRCTSLAGDDTLLKASKGWKAKSLKGALGGKVRLSTKKGATLTLAKATGKSLVIFVAKAKGSGTIGVYVKGKRVAKLSLSASKAALARLVVRTGSYAGAPIVIKVEKPGKGVRIDGIAVLK